VITLVFRLDYKCVWDGAMAHVFLIDGDTVTVEEEDVGAHDRDRWDG